MDHTVFKGGMLKLAAAYRLEIPATTMAAYWTALGQSDGQRFLDAITLIVNNDKVCPTVARIREVMREQAETARRRQGNDEGEQRDRARVYTLEDFDVHYVPKPTPFPVGTRGHEAMCKAAKKNIAAIEARLEERCADLEDRPNDWDVRRRVEILSRTLAEAEQWLTHFERTAESLTPVK